MRTRLKRTLVGFKRTALVVTALLVSVATLAPYARAATPNLITNPSVETQNSTNPAFPQAWKKNRWGVNTASFAYQTGKALDGNRSLRITMSGYTSGDAKWMFAQVSVTPGSVYTFSDYYRSSVPTNYVAAYSLTSGGIKYVATGSAAATSVWTKKTLNLTIPSGVKSVSVYHLIQRNGWLETDNYSLSSASTANPSVAITAPADGATVSATTTITAVATNAVGVSFSLDGASLGAEDTTSPYSLAWDTKTAANGTHTLKAVARSNAGATATSSITITVNNTVAPPATNLFANSSAETASSDPTAPAEWQHNSWGTNSTVFSYPVAGHTGSKAVRTVISSYADGDAKWFPNPVAVSANTTYYFQDFARSNVATEVVAELTSTTGVVSYVALGSIPANSVWQPVGFSVITRSDTARLTVYHLLNKVGWLEQDDVSLTKLASENPANPVINSSLEIANGTQPYAWNSNRWGNNTANFEYTSDAHTGVKAAKVSVSSYVDGDAKWFFNPVSGLTPGKQYSFSTWYKTNIEPRAALQYTRADGSTYYPNLPQPFPSTNSATSWSYFSETFVVPADVVSVSVFLYVAQNGWLIVDDQAITPYTPTGFNRPLVSLTFDDGSDSNVTTSLPIMKGHGFHSTQCYETSILQADPAAGKANVLAFYNNGDEICSHTITHPFLTKLTSAEVIRQLSESQSYLQAIINSPVRGFATPYGDYNQQVVNSIKNYYNWHRTVDEGYNSKDNLNRYRLRVQNLTNQTTLAEYQSWLNQAKATNTWLILVYHDVSNTPSPYGSYVADFRAQMDALASSGIAVKTVADALSEVSAQ